MAFIGKTISAVLYCTFGKKYSSFLHISHDNFGYAHRFFRILNYAMGSTSIMHKWNNVCQQQFYALKRIILLRNAKMKKIKKKIGREIRIYLLYEWEKIGKLAKSRICPIM